MKFTIIFLALLFFCMNTFANNLTDNASHSSMRSSGKHTFSTAGFFQMNDCGRKVENFNVGWRFIKKDVKNAHKRDFDDSGWDIVNCPDGLELLSTESSGCVNYQGPAWYRKHFTPGPEHKNKQLRLHFEAVMGKCHVWVNGRLIKSHHGGYLPFVVDLTGMLDFEKDNVIAVLADNSDDPTYPPGKPQDVLDFTYFGGIYRDVWLVSTNSVYITNANNADMVAGGGVFVHFEDFSKDKVTVVVDTHIANKSKRIQKVTVDLELQTRDGKLITSSDSSATIQEAGDETLTQSLTVNQPHLWTPNDPYLHNLIIKVKDASGNVIDGMRQRVGVRKIEFRNKSRFYLNGVKTDFKLLGVNRHQDYAYVGNAVPNSAQWRDAKKIRDAGLNAVRSAHYPLDPAFMDACDELGIFVIVATPGWQFWNEEPLFQERIFSDIRHMVRRDRNRPSVFLWEPILNETHYPESFGIGAHHIVHEEYPYQGALTVCDKKTISGGYEHFDVLYGDGFIREYGDNTDDWAAHNSDSRAALRWGERPQLVQAFRYAYAADRYVFAKPKEHTGATLWCGFDHQRGYHPDPFYGGLMDAFRRPKMSYHFFASQRDPSVKLAHADSGPMVYMAHEFTPFSGDDVVVFTNCDEVRLTMYDGKVYTGMPGKQYPNLPHPPVYFENVFNFGRLKALTRKTKDKSKIHVVAEGLIDGEVVVTQKKYVSRQITKIKLSIDDMGMAIVADGSDFVPVIASLTDEHGEVKRLNNSRIQFTVEGEGRIIGDEQMGANPRDAEWGTAPVLIRATTKPGKIKIKASLVHEGIVAPIADEIEFESVPSTYPLAFSEEPTTEARSSAVSNENESETVQRLKKEVETLRRELNRIKIKDVHKTQEESPADM